jgi:hypothetical protein
LQVVYDLAAQGNPFLLAAPTRRFFTPVVQSIVQQNNAALMPLDDVLTLDATGDFRVMPEGRALLMKYAEQPIDGNGVAADPQINEFRRFGSMWQIRFAGKMVFVADRQGLHYIAHLLSRPDQPIPCVQVLAATRQRNVAVGSCGTNLDAEAVATYKRRIVELEEELAEATRNHDYGRQETYQVELDCLMTEVKAAVGLGGRRRERSDAYRISKAMSMAMMRAVRAIATEHPALAEHLKDTITAGRFLCYAPKRPVTWVV